MESALFGRRQRGVSAFPPERATPLAPRRSEPERAESRWSGVVWGFGYMGPVMKGDAYLFWPLRRVQWQGSLDEKPLPASSLTRNSHTDQGNLPVLGLVSLQRDEPRSGSSRGLADGTSAVPAAGRLVSGLLCFQLGLFSARPRGTRAIYSADLQQQQALCLLRLAWRAMPVFAQPSLPRLARCATGWPQAKDGSCHLQPFGLRPTPFLLC